MAFWGIEVAPGKPFTHRFDEARGRLRISKATLGIGWSEERIIVQCMVGKQTRPTFLCGLSPCKNQSCSLDLEFAEKDDVVFSVLGPRSVHLTGFYLGTDGVGKKKVEIVGGSGTGMKRKLDNIVSDAVRQKSINGADHASDENQREVIERNKKSKPQESPRIANTKDDKNDGSNFAETEGENAESETEGEDAESETEGEDAESEMEGENEEAETEGETAESNPTQVDPGYNCLIIEKLEMGKPDGKIATVGTEVIIHSQYKLKTNGVIVFSNVGRAPHKFRLGVGQTIRGLDIGIIGMRAGDKRRIAVPPSLGYGSKGASNIPPNAWIVVDVEVVHVC